MTLSTYAFAGITLAVLVLLFVWTRSHPDFDLTDLVTGDNGRVSSNKFTAMGAFIVSTWGFATMVQQGKLTEWYFGAYMLAWTGYRAVMTAIDKTKGPTP